MSLPYFFIPSFDPSKKIIELDEDTSKHVISVLRMKRGEQLKLTDGKGRLMLCEISEEHKKHSTVNVISYSETSASPNKVSIAISLIKNSNRFEWFLEKATELGVSSIIPMICERTEKEKFREERMKGILNSAMLQSLQTWLPELSSPTPIRDVLANANHDQKFIAHCSDGEKRMLIDLVNQDLLSQIILIGPEGDFTSKEIQMAKDKHFIEVTLGNTRLRTETAGIVAATLLTARS